MMETQQLDLLADARPVPAAECVENHAGVFDEPSEVIEMDRGNVRASICLAYADGGYWWAHDASWPTGGHGFLPNRNWKRKFAYSRAVAIADAAQDLARVVERSIKKDSCRRQILRWLDALHRGEMPEAGEDAA